jgi:hypothetical protein
MMNRVGVDLVVAEGRIMRKLFQPRSELAAIPQGRLRRAVA